jgi:hypothetical protein
MPDCWLDVSTDLENPATGQLDQGFLWFSSVVRANAELVPKFHVIPYWGSIQGGSLFQLQNSTQYSLIQSVSNSPSTAEQCLSAHLLRSSCKRFYTQRCPSQDYTSCNDLLSLTVSNTRLKQKSVLNSLVTMEVNYSLVTLLSGNGN